MINKIKAHDIETICEERNIDIVQFVNRHKCGCITIKSDNVDVQCFKVKYNKFKSFEYVIEETDKIYLRLISNLPIACEECNMRNRIANRIYCDTLPKPLGFDNTVVYHGVMAYSNYSSDIDYELAKHRINEVLNNPQWQICCSTKHIGPIGIAVIGDVLVASNADLKTDIDINTNRRYFTKGSDREQYIINNKNLLDETIWSHTEIVTQHNKVDHIWVYTETTDEMKELAKQIAKDLNVECIEVEEVHLP